MLELITGAIVMLVGILAGAAINETAHNKEKE